MKEWPANFIDCEQGSPEWLKARIGNATASRIGDIMGRKKDGSYYQKRLDYMDELLAEILTGMATETYVTAEMQFGIEQEPFARSAYELANDVFVDRVGFVMHPTIGRCGASPDGLVGPDGGLEIKVPKTITHLRWRRAGVVPAEHRPQMLLNLDCCEREWWDFFSFDPRLKGDLQRFQVRLYRDEKEIKAMRDEIDKFLEELANLAIQQTSDLAQQLQGSIDRLENKKRDAVKRSRGKFELDPETKQELWETRVP